MMRDLRRSNGFSMIEILVVILIMGILMMIVAPKLIGNKKQANDSMPTAVLENAWDVTQEYFRGERGDGTLQTAQDEGSYNGISVARLRSLAPKITWQIRAQNKPAASNNNVYVQQAAGNNGAGLILCVANSTAVLCKGEDGSNSNGPVYGASTVNVATALQRMCHTKATLALASTATTTCTLNAGADVTS